jgi:hypothetical protein
MTITLGKCDSVGSLQVTLPPPVGVGGILFDLHFLFFYFLNDVSRWAIVECRMPAAVRPECAVSMLLYPLVPTGALLLRGVRNRLLLLSVPL